MGKPLMSEVVTAGIRVGATAFFLPGESDPGMKRYVFGYRIVIVNESSETVRVVGRHWVIIDANGKREEVEGAGVVGETPTLPPGTGFKYMSYCPLETAWGTMEGTYAVERADGEKLAVEIGRFFLVVPEEANGPAEAS